MGCIFGPVPSRRLGRSLGVDLVPLKTCTYDCIYCQIGRTTNKTAERREWIPLDEVLCELRDSLDTKPDYITFSGSGEPTLYSRLGELIAGIHGMTAIPVAVLTNGSLLWRPDVRADLAGAELVIPSLDAGTPSAFERVNRPCGDISFERMIDGLAAFGREYRGRLHLEVFILAGCTDAPGAVHRIARAAKEIGPDRVQLNTVTRPPAEDCAIGVSKEQLHEIAALFDPPAEVIADFSHAEDEAPFTATRRQVLALLRRRPCSLDDIADGLGIHRNEAVKYVEMLTAEGVLTKEIAAGTLYYRADTTT